MQLKAGECISFEKCDNFRELGGYIGYEGKAVKGGMFFRAPALCQIKTENDVKLFSTLGIKHIFDFRSSSEQSAQPDPLFEGITTHNIPATLTKSGEEMSFDLPTILKGGRVGIMQLLQNVSEGYKVLPFNNPAYINMFNVIKAFDTPILFHCTAGKDRTGVAAALILIMLGVSESDAISDYLLTNECRKSSISALLNGYGHMIDDKENAESFIKMIAGVEEQNLISTFTEIKKTYGNYTSYFNAEFGIDDKILQAIRENYLK